MIKDGQLYIDEEILQNLYHNYNREIDSIIDIRKTEPKIP